jgi:hypothetical protein
MTSAAQAQATRTWVSGVGDDANPCSRTAPCKTFPGAYSRTAAGGEIDALDPGGYGTINIGKAITIDGGGGQVASILASTTQGVLVTAAATDFVVLRNIRINAVPQYSSPGTYGIRVTSVGVLTVDHCLIQGGSIIGIDFEPTNHGNLNVNNSVIEDAAQGGLMSSTTSGINRVAITESSFLNNGVFGVKSGGNSRVQISNSLVSGTGQISGLGDGLNASGGALIVESTTVTDGLGTGIRSMNNGIVWMSNATVTNNSGIGLFADTGGQIFSFLNNKVANNNGGAGNPQGTPTGPAAPGQI